MALRWPSTTAPGECAAPPSARLCASLPLPRAHRPLPPPRALPSPPPSPPSSTPTRPPFPSPSPPPLSPPPPPPPPRSWLLAHTNVFVGWLFNASLSLGLVYVSTWLVVNVAPEAAGAGVAEVTAYLNGVYMPKVGGWVGGSWREGREACSCVRVLVLPRTPAHARHTHTHTRAPHPLHPPPPPPSHEQVLNIKTFLVKFASAATAVGSGLPVGPEGPMIHMGAAIGAGLSQGHSTTLGWDSGLFQRFKNPKDKRDFVTAGGWGGGVGQGRCCSVGGLWAGLARGAAAPLSPPPPPSCDPTTPRPTHLPHPPTRPSRPPGAATGVATAFSAPVGGLLFVLEEIASFWHTSLGWQVRGRGGGVGWGCAWWSAGCVEVASRAEGACPRAHHPPTQALTPAFYTPPPTHTRRSSLPA